MDDSKTIWVGNLSDQVTEELLYELFIQAGPLERVKIPTDREGRKSNFGFITFKHEVSVPYAIDLLSGTRLWEQNLNIKPRNGGAQKDRHQNIQQNLMQRSFSYPVEGHRSPHLQNEHKRFNDRSDMGMSQHHPSIEELLKMGQMMNIAYTHPDTSNFSMSFGGNNFEHSRQQSDRSSFRDRNRERDRRYDRPRNDYDEERSKGDFSGNRNQRRNRDKRNSYDRNTGRRDRRF